MMITVLCLAWLATSWAVVAPRRRPSRALAGTRAASVRCARCGHERIRHVGTGQVCSQLIYKSWHTFDDFGNAIQVQRCACPDFLPPEGD